MSSKSLVVDRKSEDFSLGIKFIQTALEDFKLSKKTVVSSMLRAEEMMVKLSENADDDAKIRINIEKSLMGKVDIYISCPGRKFDLSNRGMNFSDMKNASEENSEKMIRNAVLRAFSDSMSLLNVDGTNMGMISVTELRNRSFIIILVLVLVLVGIGFFLKDFVAELMNKTNETLLDNLMNGIDFKKQ